MKELLDVKPWESADETRGKLGLDPQQVLEGLYWLCASWSTEAQCAQGLKPWVGPPNSESNK